jgi:hypothetical protein
MSANWLADVTIATDQLFLTRLGPEISTAANVSLAIAASTGNTEPGALRDSIRFFLWLHSLIVIATGSDSRTYAYFVETGHRVVVFGRDMGYRKGPQPFLRPALYTVRGA